MANEEQLEILKQGVDVWNQWRKENPYKKIDLSNANLQRVEQSGINLSKANLQYADFRFAKFRNANFQRADFSFAYFSGADLRDADFKQAEFIGTSLVNSKLNVANLTDSYFAGSDLSLADIRNAAFRKATMTDINFREANLNEVDFSNTSLLDIDFSRASLFKSNFSFSSIGLISFGNNDLKNIIGLETVQHDNLSTIGTDTIRISKGEIPKSFLRGCGLSDWEIESAKLYNPNLNYSDIDEILYKIHDLRANQPIQISPLFISYSHADASFVDKLEENLTL